MVRRKKDIIEPKNTQRPIPPKGFDPVARRAWNSLCDDLEKQGTLVSTDEKIIHLYATTYALWERCVTQLSKEDLSTGGDDRKFINPLAPLYNNLSQKLRSLLLDCGLSPTTRKGAPSDGTQEVYDLPL